MYDNCSLKLNRLYCPYLNLILCNIDDYFRMRHSCISLYGIVIIEISCNLMTDEIYSTEDAVDALLQVIDLIEMERQGIVSDIGSNPEKRSKLAEAFPQ